MTVNKTDHTEKARSKAKQGIRGYMAMAAALLCLFGAITGCTSSAARFTEAGQGSMDKETAQQLIAPEYGLQDSSLNHSHGTASREGKKTEDAGTMSSRPTLRCNYYVEKEFVASVEAAKQQEDTGTGNGVRADGEKGTGPDGTGNGVTADGEKGTGPDGTASGVRVDGEKGVGTDGMGKDCSPDGMQKGSAAANNAGDEHAGSSSRIAGGITPHHLLAANMIAGFFRKLSDDPPKTIVIIGPNHKRIGFGGLQTSSSDWATPFGRLEADGEIVKTLVDRLNASENDSVMQEDHAISALVPYIRYYMPDVRIVPILLHGNYSSTDSLKLGKLLGKISAEDPGSIAIIASVDFSHYLDAVTAYKMDDITQKAIRNNDIKAISRMSNDNMDSPPSIITLLGAMGAAGAAEPETYGHSNSSDIAGSGYDNTTSYFTMFFRNNDK